jgi:hypothetical protein
MTLKKLSKAGSRFKQVGSKILTKAVKIKNFIGKTRKLPKSLTVASKIFGTSTFTVGLVIGIEDLLHSISAKDGVCAVVSTIGCTADVVQIAASCLPGTSYITLVTIPISATCKIIVWYFKRSKTLWCWCYLQDNVPTFLSLIFNFLKKVYLILKEVLRRKPLSPSPSVEIVREAFKVIKVIIETALEPVKKGDNIFNLIEKSV